MALTTNLRTRLAALLAGTYTTGGRYVSGVTFTESPVYLPLENPEWPDVVVDRTWDLHWSPSDLPLAFDVDGDGGQENTFQGPHVTRVGALLRVQYELTRPEQLAPRITELLLGALETATRKATDDAAVLRWMLHHTPNWTGGDVAIGCMVGRITTAKADTLRVVSTIPLTWLVSVSAVTSPGWPS